MVQVGSRNLKIDVALMEADTPLLISTEQLAKWKARIDFAIGMLEFNDFEEVIKLEKHRGTHYVLPVVSQKEIMALIVQKKETRDKNETCESFADIKKAHRMLGHLGMDKMGIIYEFRNAMNNNVKKLIKWVCLNCNICKKFKKRNDEEEQEREEYVKKEKKGR